MQSTMRKSTAERSLNKGSPELMKTNVMSQILWKPGVLPEGPTEHQKLRRVLRTTFCIDFSKFSFASKGFTSESRS